MNKESDRQIKEASEILYRYERSLMEKMAAEVVERREDFEQPFVGSAEEIVEKYSRLLGCLCRVRSGLFGYLPKELKYAGSMDTRPIGKDEFRCFRCRSIIAPDTDACHKCGWTWG